MKNKHSGKISQSNIKVKKIQKTSVDSKHRTDPKRDLENPRQLWLEDYQEFFTKQLKPVNQAFLDRLGCEMIEYFEDPNAEVLRIGYFFTKKRIDPDTGRNWANKYPEFGRVYEFCKKIIGYRREDGATRKGWSFAALPMFDDEYRSLKEWESKVKNDMLNSGTKMVLVESYFKNEEKKEQGK